MRFKKEFIIGFISLVALVGLIFGIKFVKGNNPFVNTNTVYAIYDSVDNLKPGNPVRISGLSVGRVAGVELLPGKGAKVLVSLNLETEYRIPKNSLAQIIDMDFLGSKGIDIMMGDSKELLHIGDTIQSEVKNGVFADLKNDLMPFSEKMEKFISNFDETIQSIKITSDNLNKELSGMNGQVSNSLTHFNELSTSLRSAIEEAQGVFQRVNTKVDSLDADGLNQVIADFSTTSQKLNGLLDDLKNGDGTMGQLMTDHGLYENMVNTTKEMESLLKDLQNNPKKYVHFSVFGKKDK